MMSSPTSSLVANLTGEGAFWYHVIPCTIIMQVSVGKQGEFWYHVTLVSSLCKPQRGSRENSGIMSPWYHHYASLSGEAGSILVSCHPCTIIMQVSVGSEETFWYHVTLVSSLCKPQWRSREHSVSCHPAIVIMQVSVGKQGAFWYHITLVPSLCKS